MENEKWVLDKGVLGMYEGYFLQEMVRKGKNVVIVGGTGSGKTTLLATLIRFMDEKPEMLVVEETKELPVDAEERLPVEMWEEGSEVFLQEALNKKPDVLVVDDLREHTRDAFGKFVQDSLKQGLATVHGQGVEDVFLKEDDKQETGVEETGILSNQIDVVVVMNKKEESREAKVYAKNEDLKWVTVI